MICVFLVVVLVLLMIVLIVGLFVVLVVFLLLLLVVLFVVLVVWFLVRPVLRPTDEVAALWAPYPAGFGLEPSLPPDTEVPAADEQGSGGEGEQGGETASDPSDSVPP